MSKECMLFNQIPKVKPLEELATGIKGCHFHALNVEFVPSSYLPLSFHNHILVLFLLTDT